MIPPDPEWVKGSSGRGQSKGFAEVVGKTTLAEVNRDARW
jgi:hypothetical protein